MQGIYTYIPETNYVPREYSVAAILLLLFMVIIIIIIIIIILLKAAEQIKSVRAYHGILSQGSLNYFISSVPASSSFEQNWMLLRTVPYSWPSKTRDRTQTLLITQDICVRLNGFNVVSLNQNMQEHVPSKYDLK